MVSTIVIAVIIAGICAGIVYNMYRKKKQGKGSCGCGCSGCAMESECKNQRDI